MRHPILALFVPLCCLVAACGQPEPTPLQVGPHEISLVFPSDWEHFDYGEKHLFRKDFERISLEDMGRLGWDIDLAIKQALKNLREDDRREIASRDSLLIDGREARALATWDLVSHQYPKHFLFVMNERSLLALHTAQGRLELMDSVFEGLRNSLAFVDTLDIGGQPGTDGGN